MLRHFSRLLPSSSATFSWCVVLGFVLSLSAYLVTFLYAVAQEPVSMLELPLAILIVASAVVLFLLRTGVLEEFGLNAAVMGQRQLSSPLGKTIPSLLAQHKRWLLLGAEVLLVALFAHNWLPFLLLMLWSVFWNFGVFRFRRITGLKVLSMSIMVTLVVFYAYSLVPFASFLFLLSMGQWYWSVWFQIGALLLSTWCIQAGIGYLANKTKVAVFRGIMIGLLLLLLVVVSILLTLSLAFGLVQLGWLGLYLYRLVQYNRKPGEITGQRVMQSILYFVGSMLILASLLWLYV